MWHIQRVAVKSEFRKRSLGTEVLREIENVAYSKHIQLLTLGAQDKAQNFYLKLGYQVKGAGFLDAGIK
ncbi:GNAT family N-acetyltransferase, partial [Lactiplantibacillus pentosus]